MTSLLSVACLVLASLGPLTGPAPGLRAPAPPARDLAAPARSAPSVALTHLELDVSLDLQRRWLDQIATLDVVNAGSDTLREVPFILGRLFTVQAAAHDGVAARFTQAVVEYDDSPAHQVRALRVTLRAPLAPGARTRIRITSTGTVTGLTEVGYLYVQDRVDSAYTLLREDAHAWPMPGVPSDSLSRRRPASEFTSRIRAEVPLGQVAASAGRLVGADTAGGRVTWRYDNPEPAPFVFVAIAPFVRLHGTGIDIFALPQDSAGARELRDATARSRAQLVAWYGEPVRTGRLTVIEIPEGWGSQASATGGIILQASAFRDRRRRRELYHELVHLWNPPDTERPSPRWNEGFSSFVEWLLAERLDSLPGRAASEDRTVQVLARRITSEPALREVPAADYGAHGMTDHAYAVGRVMFAVLHARIGDAAFHRIYRRYRTEQPDGGGVRDLVRIARDEGGEEAARVFDDWLLTTRWTQLVGPGVTVAQLAAR